MLFSSEQTTHFCSKGVSHKDNCECECEPCLSRSSALKVQEHIKKINLGSTETQKEIAAAIARAKLTIKKK